MHINQDGGSIICFIKIQRRAVVSTAFGFIICRPEFISGPYQFGHETKSWKDAETSSA